MVGGSHRLWQEQPERRAEVTEAEGGEDKGALDMMERRLGGQQR